MNYKVFRYRIVQGQLKLDEFPVGMLRFRDGQVEIDIRDRKLQKKLDALYQQSFITRKPLGSINQIVSLKLEEVEPGSLEHFKAFLGAIRDFELTAKLVPQR